MGGNEYSPGAWVAVYYDEVFARSVEKETGRDTLLDDDCLLG
jgi:hypothetical protein